MGPDGAPGGFYRTAAGRDACSPVEWTPADKEALAEPEFDWGSAYVIGREADGTWYAARRDRIGAILTAPTAKELRVKIREDYEANPVPSELPEGDAQLMILWLWDAGSAHGVSDDGTRARKAAEAFIGAGRASSARVESARLVIGLQSRYSGYTRLGRGWVAVPRQDGPVRWVALAAELAEGMPRGEPA